MSWEDIPDDTDYREIYDRLLTGTLPTKVQSPLLANILNPPPPSDYALSYTDNAPIPADIKDTFQKDQKFWTQQLAGYGLEYKVFWGSWLGLISLAKDYDLAHNPGEGWIPGTGLLAKWETPAKDLTGISSSLQIFLWRKETTSMEPVNEKIPYQWDILQFQKDPRNWIDVQRKVPPNIWFSVPQWWWCKVEHIEFYEKLEHDNGSKWAAELKVSLEWLSMKEVGGRLELRLPQLVRIIEDGHLSAYYLSSHEGIQVAYETFFSQSGGMFSTNPLGRCLLKLTEVQAFENAEAKKKANKRIVPSLNEHRRDRLLARDLAKPWIREDPGIRSGTVVKRLRETSKFKHIFRDETLRGYIADLIINRKAGASKGPQGTRRKHIK